MSKPLQFVLALCALALTGAAIYGGYGLNRHAIEALDAWKGSAVNLQPTLDKANATLDAINAPCVGFHGSYTCGPLAQLSQTEKNLGILAAQAVVQVKQSATLVNTASTAVTSATKDVHTMAMAGTRTLDAATDTLGEGKRTIAATQPLLAAYTRSGDDLDALLKDRAIHETLGNVNAISRNTASTTGDLAAVSDDLKRRYFAPVPWWKKILGGAEFTVKAGNKALGWW